MHAAVKELLTSKKFLVGITSSVTALIVRLAPKLGLGEFIDAETASQMAQTIVVLASAYLVGQGAADFGKSAANAPAAPTAPPAAPEPPKPTT
jgi:hypothetical protein